MIPRPVARVWDEKSLDERVETLQCDVSTVKKPLVDRTIRRFEGREIAALLVVLAAGILACRPLLSVPFPDGHDALAHLFRVVELDRAWRQGVLFPRWLPSLLFGYGYPLFNFMAPLVTVVAVLFHLAGLSLIAAPKATLALGLLASGFAMFFFARDVFGRAAATLSAVAYVLTPYFLFDVYVRMAMMESFAFPFLPLILWSVHRAVTGNRSLAGWWGGLPLAGLALTHNPSALLFVPLSALYGLTLACWPSRKPRRRRGLLLILGRLSIVYALGLGLSAFLWLPALREQQYVFIGTLPQGDRQFFNLLFAPADLIQPSLFFQYRESSPLQVHVGLVQALLAVLASFWAWRVRPCWRGSVGAAALIALVPLFLITRFAAPLWELAPNLTLMSFPSRLLMFVSLGLAILIGLLAALGSPFGYVSGSVGIPSPLAPLASTSLSHHPTREGESRPRRMNSRPRLQDLPAQVGTPGKGEETSPVHSPRRRTLFPWARFQPPAHSPLRAGEGPGVRSGPKFPLRYSKSPFLVRAIRNWLFPACLVVLLAVTSLKDLSPLPLDLKDTDLSRAALARFEAQSASAGTTSPTQLLPNWIKISPREIPAPQGAPSPSLPAVSPLQSVRLTEMNGWHLTALVVAGDEGRLIGHQIYFPGWQARVDDRVAGVEPYGPLGLISVVVPPGEHRVQFSLENTSSRQLGETISLLSLLLLIGLGLWRLSNRFPIGRRARYALVPSLLVIALFGLFLPRQSDRAIAAVEPLSLEPAPGQSIIGWRADTSRLGENGFLELSVFWHVRRAPTGDFRERIRLLDQSGRVVAEIAGRPDLGNSPTAKWYAGEILEDRQDVPWPEAVPPGRYTVELALDESVSLGPRPGQTSEFVHLGEVEVGKVPVRQPLPPVLAGSPEVDFGGQIVLRGLFVDGHAPSGWLDVQPGGDLEVEMFYQAVASVTTDYGIFLHLDDRLGQTKAQVDSFPPGDLRFTSLWPVGAIVRQRFRLSVPFDDIPAVYDLTTGFYRRTDMARLAVGGPEKRDSAVVAQVRVKGQPRPAIKLKPLEARFANGIILAGWNAGRGPADNEVRRGGPVSLNLLWRTRTVPDRDYTVFVQLLDNQGRLVAQSDRQPLAGRYPTSAWRLGEELVDNYSLNLSPSLPAGDYTLIAGLYGLPDTERVMVSVQGGTDDKVILGTIRVID